MKEIFIINGSGGVGKDTFVEMCATFVPTLNYSSVKGIKEIAQKVGWNGGKTERDRKFLSDLKLLTSEYSDYSFNCICETIEDFYNSKYQLLFIHIRDIGEIERVVQAFPYVKTILVTNDRVPLITSNEADANVANYQYDYNIKNNGSLEDLLHQAEIFTTRSATMDDIE